MLVGSQGTGPPRGYIQNLADGARLTFTGDGVNASAFSTLPIAPDGSSVWLIGSDGQPALFPLDGGPPRPLRGVLPEDNLAMWARNGRELYVSSTASASQPVFRIDLATGTRTLWKDVVPLQPAGVRLSQVAMTWDKRTLLHSYSQLLTNLYVLTGLSAR